MPHTRSCDKKKKNHERYKGDTVTQIGLSKEKVKHDELATSVSAERSNLATGVLNLYVPQKRCQRVSINPRGSGTSR